MGREKGPLPITTTLVVLERIEGEVSAVTEPRRLRKMPPSLHTASKEEQARAVIVPPLVVRCEADRERARIIKLPPGGVASTDTRRGKKMEILGTHDNNSPLSSASLSLPRHSMSIESGGRGGGEKSLDVRSGRPHGDVPIPTKMPHGRSWVQRKKSHLCLFVGSE